MSGNPGRYMSIDSGPIALTAPRTITSRTVEVRDATEAAIRTACPTGGLGALRTRLGVPDGPATRSPRDTNFGGSMSTTTGASSTDQAREKAQETAQKAQETAQQAASQARGRLSEQVDQRSTTAGEQVSTTADDVRSVAQQLREQGKEQPAKIAEQAADRAERLADYLKRADGDSILRDAEDLGRRQPWAVIFGGVAAGFLASRFLKASSSR